MNDRRYVAFHEAGHAVIGRAMAQMCDGASVESNPEEGEAGFAITCDHWTTMAAWDQLGRWREARSIILGRIITYMAGRVAEEELLGESQGGDDDDQQQIGMMLDAICRDEDPAFRARLMTMTRAAVRRHRRTIEAVATALLEHGKLDHQALSLLMPFPSLGYDESGQPSLLKGAC